MTGPALFRFSCLSSLSLLPTLVMVVFLSGCQSSQIPEWIQAERSAQPATRAPVLIRPPVSQTLSGTSAGPATRALETPDSPAPLPPMPPTPEQTPEQKNAALSLRPLLSRSMSGPDSGFGSGTSPEPSQPVPARAADTVRVALLLPLSGPNAPVGKSMQNAAQMAMFSFSKDNFELVFYDTFGLADGAAQASRAAVSDGASLILGPLLAASVKAATPAARTANVPLVAFSSDQSVAGEGVFTMGFFPQAEVARVVRYARGKGLARFAILAPRNDHGVAVAETLRQTAIEVGAVVTQVEFYNPEASDFGPVVRRLANYSARRAALAEQKAILTARDDDIAKRALARLASMQTLGGLSFDALMLADGGKRLQAVAALLPFYDIDPKKVKILGTGQWDEPTTGSEPALSGGWFAAPEPALRAEFVTRYKQMFAAPPHRLATLAYDATALAAVLAYTEQGPVFSREGIMAANGFEGRDGIFRFLPGGLAQRGLAVMEATQRGSRVIAPAPTTFQASPR